MVKRLPGARRIRSVRVSARTEPWRPDSCTGKIYGYDPVLLVDDDTILYYTFFIFLEGGRGGRPELAPPSWWEDLGR